MGEEFQAAICGDNYWWNSSTTRSSLFPFMTCSVAAAANDSASCWQVSDFMDFNKGPTTRSSSSHEEQDTNNKCSNNNNESSTSAAASGSIFMDSTLQMMAYGLSSSPPSSTTCWNNNPSLFGCNERSENNNFQSIMVEEERGLDSANNNKNKEFELMGCVSSGFQIGSSSSSANTYGYPSTMIQGGLFDPTDSSSSLFTPPTLPDEFSPTWSTVSSLMKPSSPSMEPKQQIHNNGLQFSNNNTTPFWNASSPHHDIITSPALFSSSSSSQPHQYQTPPPPTSTPLNKLKREESPEKASSGGSKSASERAFKRTRIETPSPLPTFKVRKEKLGDRITALQQLVSPFGKTDTASVLHEAIEYIKFLHDQVNVLTTPYMKNGAPIIQHQQGCDNGKDSGGAKQDLRSRGLCLVPVASTFPMATETTADFWTPTFGGTLIGSGR